MKRTGVTLNILWEEYKQKHPEGIMYSRFCYHYSKWNQKSDGYMPAVYKAGDKLFIDYAGKKLHIINRETGEIKPVEVFMGTLETSQYKNWYDLIEEKTIADAILDRIIHSAIKF